MLTIGITGGIGSGKSIVAKVIENMGYPVFNSDEAAKDLMQNDSETRVQLIELFGTSVFENGQLNRKVLAEIVFKDDNARAKINALIHPKVRRAFENFAQNSRAQLVFNEAAIFFETGSHERFDRMVLVTAPEELKIERVMKRDGVSEDQVRERMAKQWSDAQKIPLADFVLLNDERTPLLAQIEQTIDQLISS